jgi:hypothetical protein
MFARRRQHLPVQTCKRTALRVAVPSTHGQRDDPAVETKQSTEKNGGDVGCACGLCCEPVTERDPALIAVTDLLAGVSFVVGPQSTPMDLAGRQGVRSPASLITSSGQSGGASPVRIDCRACAETSIALQASPDTGARKRFRFRQDASARNGTAPGQFAQPEDGLRSHNYQGPRLSGYRMFFRATNGSVRAKDDSNGRNSIPGHPDFTAVANAETRPRQRSHRCRSDRTPANRASWSGLPSRTGSAACVPPAVSETSLMSLSGDRRL